MEMVSESEHDAGENVVPCVSDHARTKTAAQNGETAEERAKCGDGDHAGRAFVSVAHSNEEATMPSQIACRGDEN